MGGQSKHAHNRNAGERTPFLIAMLDLLFSEPKTAILGGPDIHLKEGSTMNLTCIISDSPEPPSYIFWRHDDAVRSSFICRKTAAAFTKTANDDSRSFPMIHLEVE